VECLVGWSVGGVVGGSVCRSVGWWRGQSVGRSARQLVVWVSGSDNRSIIIGGALFHGLSESMVPVIARDLRRGFQLFCYGPLAFGFYPPAYVRSSAVDFDAVFDADFDAVLTPLPCDAGVDFDAVVLLCRCLVLPLGFHAVF